MKIEVGIEEVASAFLACLSCLWGFLFSWGKREVIQDLLVCMLHDADLDLFADKFYQI